MDNITGESSSMYRKERDSFLDGLRRFHAGRGTHVRQIPTIGGKEVDLFQLYRQVTVRGGWEKVNQEQKWEDIAEMFHLPPGCANASQALQYIYIRYLELYEKCHFFGEDPDQRRTDGQDELPGQRKKQNYASRVPMSYNQFQHKLSDYMRQNLSLPMPKDPDIYMKIEQSLASGLPNEVDFAMNICTLLSSEGKHTLNLNKSPQIVYLMLGHIGVFDTGPGSLKDVHLEAWKPASGHNFLRFWWESIEDKDIRKLICPEVRPESSEAMGGDEQELALSRLLNIKRESGMYDKEGQRVVQVAMVLRNLSFEESNMKVLASNDVFLRYIILATHCNYHSVRQLALDTLGNVGLKMVLNPLDPYLKCVLFTILRHCLLSSDKFEVVTGLELLARLCQVPTNDEVLCDALEPNIYDRIVSYLTVHDIQLIAHTLECLYQLSELGEVPTSHIARVSRAVATLVSLVTVEAQSYGPESIKGIRVVEHIPAGMVSSMAAPQPCEAVPRPMVTKGATPQKPAMPQVMRRPPAVPTPPTQVRGPATATPPSQPAASQFADGGRSLTSRWLQSFYEVDLNSQVNKMEIYANYLQALSKIGHTQVPDMREMIIALRATFPRVDIVKIEKDNGSTPIVFVKGIRPRANQLPFDPNAPSRFPPNRVPLPGQTVTAGPSRSNPPQTHVPILPRPGTPQSTPAQQLPSHRPSFTPPPQPLVQSGSTPVRTSIIQNSAQPTPPQSPLNQPSVLQQALMKNPEPTNGMEYNVTPPSPSLTPPLNPVQIKPGDQNLIKTLLANKLQQNMQRYQEMQDQSSLPEGQAQPAAAALRPNGTQLPASAAVDNTSNEMAPPRGAPNTPSNPSSAFENEFQQFMQTQTHEVPVNPQVPVKRTRKKSASSPQKAKVKRTQSCDEQPESIVDSNAKSVCDSVKVVINSAELLKYGIDTGKDTLQNQVKLKGESLDSKPNVSVPLCDQKQPESNTLNVDIKNHEVQCDVNQISHKSENSLDSSSQISVKGSGCENSSRNKDPLFNGMISPSQSPKEISPNKLNTSIEEKKARIAQLMKDTKILKEQLKGINGVTISNDKSNDKSNDLGSSSSKSNESHVNESQGSKGVNCSKTDEAQGDVHCQVNGFPETANGNHTVQPSNCEHSSEKDLKCETNGPVSASAELVNTKGLTLDDLNRNNNCNGDGDSPLPSGSTTEPPSVQLNSSEGNQPAENSSDSQPAHQNNAVSNPGVLAAPPVAPGQFVQPNQLPGSISTPKVIMSAMPQGTSFAQNIASQITNSNTPQTNTQLAATATQQSLHEIVAQANQVVAQPQMVAQGGQTIQQQTQIVPQGGQLISQQISVPVQNTGQPQVVSATQVPQTNQVTVPQQLQQIVQGQLLQQAGQALVQQVQGQILNQQNPVVNTQDLLSQAAVQSQVVQGQVVTQAQVVNPQGQIVQQSLPTHVVQQLLQQAQLAQQASQGQVVVQQAPQAMQHGTVLVQPAQSQVVATPQVAQGAVLVQQAQNQVVPQMVQGQVIVQSPAQTTSQVTVTLPQTGQNQLSLNVGQVIQQQLLVPQQQMVQQQVVQRPVLVQQTQNRQILPQPAVVQPTIAPQVVQSNVLQQPVRFVSQSATSAQLPIQVSTTTSQLTTQNVALINQSQGSPAMQKTNQYSVMQQQLHSSNPSITTPPPASPQSSRSSPGPMPSPGGSKPAKRPPSRQSDAGGDKPKKKRARSKDGRGASVSSTPSPAATPVPSPMVVQYICEWNACNKCFETSKQLQKHVIQTHHPTVIGVDGFCPWQGCDNLKRQRWSLITHIQDKHMNEAALRAAALRRHQQAQSPAASPSPAAAPPVYPNDAAVQAIKRFAVKPPYQEFMEMKEGPVTKHIRLTSALILRNLARYSAIGRKELKKHEHQLAYVALSPVESSAAISSCLMELQKA